MSKEDNDVYLTMDQTESRGFSVLRTDNELFDDEAYVPEKVINVKIKNLSRKNESWEIIEDGEVLASLKSTRFTKAEKAFLKSAPGMLFLMAEYKIGKPKIIALKKKMKKLIKKANQ